MVDLGLSRKRLLEELDRVNKRVAALKLEPEPEEPPKNPAAVALGRLGGLKGGIARKTKLPKARRSEIARKAVQARWNKQRES